jgi:hypothetical protein
VLLADEVVEEAIYDTQALRNFSGADPCQTSAPSTKSNGHGRDTEIYQTKKGTQWHLEPTSDGI